MGLSLKLFSRCLLLICICIGEYQCKNVEIRGSARNGYFSKVKRGYLVRFYLLPLPQFEVLKKQTNNQTSKEKYTQGVVLTEMTFWSQY